MVTFMLIALMGVDLLIWAEKSLGNPVAPTLATQFKRSAAYAAWTAAFMSTSAPLFPPIPHGVVSDRSAVSVFQIQFVRAFSTRTGAKPSAPSSVRTAL